jgi:hypothetical protein
VMQTFIRVRWAWITMLATQLFLTSLFLISVVIETWIARARILKGSTLATMCALNPIARAAVGPHGADDLEELNKRAGKQRVMLNCTASGHELLLAGEGISTVRSKMRRREHDLDLPIGPGNFGIGV